MKGHAVLIGLQNLKVRRLLAVLFAGIYFLHLIHLHISLYKWYKKIYNVLYNNTCSFCIFIGRELCVIKIHTHGWRQLMAWSNLGNLFCGSSHDFCQLFYNIKQIDFIFLFFCTVIDHTWRHSAWRTKSHGTRLRLVRTFLFFTRHDVICDLLQYRRTHKWNLFVK